MILETIPSGAGVAHRILGRGGVPDSPGLVNLPAHFECRLPRLVNHLGAVARGQGMNHESIVSRGVSSLAELIPGLLEK